MYSESDLLPLSGLQHLVYCERQWALIHIEQQWAENRLTAEGRQMHDRAHEQHEEWREGIRISRGLAVRSLRLGLSGKVDVVEFHPQVGGLSQPFPIEYKHGRPKPDRCDEVQLCAQALCLQEMLGVEVPRGAIFYGEVHETIDGPDGKYVCLGVQNAREVVALRVDLLAEATGKAAAGSKEWTAGMQVALLGTTMGRFKMPSGEQGIYVLPFDWLPTPGVGVTMPGGDRRMGPGPPDRPDRPDRPGPPDRADWPGPRGPGGWGPGR